MTKRTIEVDEKDAEVIAWCQRNKLSLEEVRARAKRDYDAEQGGLYEKGDAGEDDAGKSKAKVKPGITAEQAEEVATRKTKELLSRDKIEAAIDAELSKIPGIGDDPEALESLRTRTAARLVANEKTRGMSQAEFLKTVRDTAGEVGKAETERARKIAGVHGSPAEHEEAATHAAKMGKSGESSPRIAPAKEDAFDMNNPPFGREARWPNKAEVKAKTREDAVALLDAAGGIEPGAL